MKQAIDSLVTFKSQDFIEWTAYNLAEQNNFLGSQDFYWNIAIEKAKAFSSELEARSIILEIEISRIKHYLRSHFAY